MSPPDAVDADRPEADLVFALGRSECGNVSLQSAPNVTVSNFTRSQLIAGEVVFSHTRPGEGAGVAGDCGTNRRGVVTRAGAGAEQPVLCWCRFRARRRRRKVNRGRGRIIRIWVRSRNEKIQ